MFQFLNYRHIVFFPSVLEVRDARYPFGMFRMFFPPLEEATLEVTSGASFEAFLLFGSSGSLARGMQNVIFLFFSFILFQIAL